jgi:aspartyl/asparaginyl beta-hydroxylase (cupin superfamily)
MSKIDLVSKQREAAHKYAAKNAYPPFEWEVQSNHIKLKNGIPQGNIRYTFYDDDNDLQYEGDIRIIEGEDGLIRQDIDFKLVEGQYEDVVNSFNIYRLYSTQVTIGYWVCDTYQHINIICIRGYGEKAAIRAKLAARYWKQVLGVDCTPSKFLGEDVLEVPFNLPEPLFYDTDKIDILQKIKSKFPQIQLEILDYIKSNEFYDYPKYEVSNELYDGELYKNDWKAIPLSEFEEEHVELTEDDVVKSEINNKLPKIKGLIPTYNKIIKQGEKEGWIRNSFLSKLNPGSIIEPHKGWSNNFLRCHIGIDVDNECYITKELPNSDLKIKETRTWKEGEWIAFQDGGNYLHSVKHKGTKPRIVLSLDLNLDYIFEGSYLKYAQAPLRSNLYYSFTTTIIKGRQKTPSFPTANFKEKPNLNCGLYIVDTNFGKALLIHFPPSIKNPQPTSVHILNFNKDIYEKEITISNPRIINDTENDDVLVSSIGLGFDSPLIECFNKFCEEI